MIKTKAFLCHSSVDIDLARAMVEAIEKKEIDCWASFRDLQASDAWPTALADAIKHCEFFILLLTANSNRSIQVLREATLADNNGKRIYCLQIERIALSDGLKFFLTALQRYEAYDVPFDTALTGFLTHIGFPAHLRQAKELLLRGDHEGAYYELKKAEATEPEASFYLGRHYFTGFAPGYKDDLKAKEYFDKALDKNNPMGYYGLGLIAEVKRSTWRDSNRFFRNALEYILSGAQMGDFMCCFLLGNYYRLGRGGVPKDDEKALSWYLRSAAFGFGDAEVYAGEILIGRGDFASGRRLYLSAAARNCFFAPLMLGNLYETGKGVEKDLRTAFEWYEKASKFNNCGGYYKVGKFYLFGEYVEKNATIALGYLRQAERLLSSDAILLLGALHLDGVDLPLNEDQGIAYYEQAYELGHDYAAYHLWKFYEGKKDTPQAQKWHHFARAAGVKEAQ